MHPALPKNLTLVQHFDKPVSMVTADGSTFNKTRGFTVRVTVWPEDQKVGNTFAGVPYSYHSGSWSVASDDSDNSGSGVYGCGSLTFFSEGQHGKCFDYDGCFDLSHYVCDMLTEAGYDMTEVDSRLF